MIAAATRQDLQGAMEHAKNAIMQRMVSPNHLQLLADQLRVGNAQNLRDLHMENAQLSMRLSNIEQEMRALRQVLGRILDQQTKAMNKLQNM